MALSPAYTILVASISDYMRIIFTQNNVDYRNLHYRILSADK